MPILRLLSAMLGLLLITACSPQPDEQTYSPSYSQATQNRTVYRFAIHPLHNPQKLNEVFAPLLRYLTERIPDASFELEASRDYAAFEDKLRQRRIEFILPNPYQTLLAEKHGYRVFAKMGNDEDFHGLIISRRDSNISQISQLKNKTIAYPAPTAMAAAMLPQSYLQQSGLDVNRDIRNIYVGSQESSILAAYLKQADVAATWPPPWRAFQQSYPDKAAQLQVLWKTSSLPSNSLMARDDLPDQLVQQVRTVLLDMPNTEEGRQVLKKMGFNAFQPADSKTYEPVRKFITHFNQHIRPVETYSDSGN